MNTLVVGAGYWGQIYLKELSRNAVAVLDTDESKVEEIGYKFNIPCYTDADSIVENFDHVIIATPPDTHIDLALPFLENGCKVLIEKPLSTSIEDAMCIYGYKDKVMVSSVYLYNDGIQAMKGLMKSYPLDHIFMRRSNAGPVRPWLNAMWDLAPHDVGIANYLMDSFPITMIATGGVNWSMLNLIYPGDFSCLIYVSWNGAPKTRIVELVPLHNDQNGGARIVYDDMKVVYEKSPIQNMLEAFFAGNWDRGTLDQGIDVVKILKICDELYMDI